MKTLLTLGLLMFCSNARSQTQLDLNLQAWESCRKADTELNRVYQEVIKAYATDTVFTDNLRHAQRLWIKLRDLELKLKFPNEPSSYGSVFSMCYCSYLEELTFQRTEALRQWLDGSEEGDVCAGSAKISSSE